MGNFNGVIEWASGTTEYVNVSSSSDFLTFSGTGFSSNSVVIYSRIAGASDNKCEFYVNEPNPKSRLVLCGDGEVRLMNSGKTLNVGRLKIFESS
ncbi:hypothetical protein CS022_00005 [Veronia nyctiphanis]|uniref:Uncharacterized protein n=2 Tax=Veronia nyctiphanis TaxID=1278244 RepID=A0A4Q0Z0M0_9GAMM|nr:hypothetical protein CS022_00005 [Veronia nyctiphanis]